MTSFLDTSIHDTRLEVDSMAHTPATWGSPINTETKLLLLAYAFETLRVGRVQLKTDVRTVRSQRAIANIGAHEEGPLRKFQRRSDGSIRKTILFSIISEEWPTVQEHLKLRLATSSD